MLRWNWLAYLAAASIVVLLTLPVTGQPTEPADVQRMLDRHSGQVMEINRGIGEVFGPVPAIASTPFLGLAVLSSAAMLVDSPKVAQSGWPIAQQVRHNVLIVEARRYASWWLVGALLILALITGLANAGKIQGVVGKFLRGGEDVAIGLTYVVLAIGAMTPATRVTSAVPEQLQWISAGFFSAFDSSAMTLAIAAAIGLAAMMVLRFAFDLLVWLNPVPLLDLLFEVLKSIFSLAFLTLYFVSPVLAAVAGALLLLPCLLTLPWALRLVTFAWLIVLRPILASLSLVSTPTLVDHELSKDTGPGSTTLACRGKVLKGRTLKKRQSVTLLQVDGLTTLRGPTRKTTRVLCGAHERIQVGRALAWLEVRVVDECDHVLDRIALPRSFTSQHETITRLLGGRDVGDFGAMEVVKSAGRTVRDGLDAVSGSRERCANSSDLDG